MITSILLFTALIFATALLWARGIAQQPPATEAERRDWPGDGAR